MLSLTLLWLALELPLWQGRTDPQTVVELQLQPQQEELVGLEDSRSHWGAPEWWSWPASKVLPWTVLKLLELLPRQAWQPAAQLQLQAQQEVSAGLGTPLWPWLAVEQQVLPQEEASGSLVLLPWLLSWLVLDVVRRPTLGLHLHHRPWALWSPWSAPELWLLPRQGALGFLEVPSQSSQPLELVP